MSRHVIDTESRLPALSPGCVFDAESDLFLDGYARRNPLTRLEQPVGRAAMFRPMTPEETRRLTREHWFVTVRGCVRRARVTGKLKTWKRSPDRFRLPVKYGMYEPFAWVNTGSGVGAESGAPCYPVVRTSDWHDWSPDQ